MDRQIQMAEVVQAINKQTRTDEANSIIETDSQLQYALTSKGLITSLVISLKQYLTVNQGWCVYVVNKW